MADHPRFLKPSKFAAVAGLSESTVRRRIQDGSIPSIQPGGPGTRELIPSDALDCLQLAESEQPDLAAIVESDESIIENSANTTTPEPKILGPSPRWTQQT